MFYFVKTPGWLKKIYRSYEWSREGEGKTVYLTFDDGPHPEVTPFVLKQLREHDALATFFCIGKNVKAYPEIYKQVQDGGHSIGNHTYSHLNAWKTGTNEYLADVAKASDLIASNLFRPPYGRITPFIAKNLPAAMKGQKPRVIMWDVLSADFDTKITPQRCLENVIWNIRPGSIITFHDSAKAFPRLEYTLPRTLVYLRKQGFECRSL